LVNSKPERQTENTGYRDTGSQLLLPVPHSVDNRPSGLSVVN
jgi:hypothetical protein